MIQFYLYQKKVELLYGRRKYLVSKGLDLSKQKHFMEEIISGSKTENSALESLQSFKSNPCHLSQKKKTDYFAPFKKKSRMEERKNE